MGKNLSNNQILLRECIKQEYEETSGYANESEFFEHFVAAEVLKDLNLSDDEIDSGNTGGGNDGGCDGLYLFLNDELITEDQISTLTASKGSILKFCIIQAKNELGFKEDALMKWKTISENLLSMSKDVSDFKERYSESVIAGFTLFRDAVTKLVRAQIKTQISYCYVSLGEEVHPNTQQQADELKDTVQRYYPSTKVEVQFIGANELMQLFYRNVEESVELELADQPISLGQKDYLALVNLGTYYKFITDETSTLKKSYFEANVRDYQGRNAVNSSIAETLENNTQEDFWWLNNGVTILASQIALITNRSLRVISPEIVNGLQTSREIYNFFKSHPEELESEKRNVLVRIIMPESEESRDNIIFATNNQTNIPKSSLRVTDPIHLQIEMYFKTRGLYYDRRKNYYKNQKKKSADIIGVSFLAQCLIALVLRKPDFARARPSTLLTDDATYEKLYEKNKDLEVFYKAAYLGRTIKVNLAHSSNMSSTERNDILYYLLYAVVAKRVGKREITFADVKSFDIDALSDKEIDEMKDIVYQKYKELGGNSRVAKSTTFVNDVSNAIGL